MSSCCSAQELYLKPLNGQTSVMASRSLVVSVVFPNCAFSSINLSHSRDTDVTQIFQNI